MKSKNKVVVSGMRPTGLLHLGHYFGVLKNWLELQDRYDCYFFIADWHALTTEYANTKNVHQWVREILLDWLAVGMNPEKAVLFLQSRVPEHAELYLLLGMMTPLGWLERVPSYKELKTELKDRDLSTYGFLGYPLLQTADVAIYNADIVPVGQDQVAHLELSREIIRRFNHLYQSVFTEPKAILTPSAKVLGLDGRKMSKSYQNSIYLSDNAETTRKKMMSCLTDPARGRRTDPGNPDLCPLFSFHQLFSPQETTQQVDQDCRRAAIGCVDCKKIACQNVMNFLGPIQEKREGLKKDPDQLEAILESGSKNARHIAQKNLAKIQEVMGL